MSTKQKKTPDEITAANTRFMVGSPKATYISGKSVRPIPTFTLDMAKKAADYLSQMDFGQQVIFELVPVDIDPDGGITRQT